jgi:oligosaccharyltransferase complex subunit delta (ribophorin II)
LYLPQWTALPHNTPKLKDSHIAPFVLLLAVFEALLVWYWIGLKLPQVLVYGGILGIVTAAAGKRALVATGKWRLQVTS